MRICQLSCDWKEDFPKKEISAARKSVLGDQCVYNYDQSEVDSKVCFVSSHWLSQLQLEQLWKTGDLLTGDKDYWGGSFEEILQQIKDYVLEIEE